MFLGERREERNVRAMEMEGEGATGSRPLLTLLSSLTQRMRAPTLPHQPTTPINSPAGWQPSPAKMCLNRGTRSRTDATRPSMGAGTPVAGSPHRGKDRKEPMG